MQNKTDRHLDRERIFRMRQFSRQRRHRLDCSPVKDLPCMTLDMKIVYRTVALETKCDQHLAFNTAFARHPRIVEILLKQCDNFCQMLIEIIPLRLHDGLRSVVCMRLG